MWVINGVRPKTWAPQLRLSLTTTKRRGLKREGERGGESSVVLKGALYNYVVRGPRIDWVGSWRCGMRCLLLVIYLSRVTNFTHRVDLMFDYLYGTLRR